MIVTDHELITFLHLNSSLVTVLLYISRHLHELFASGINIVTSGSVSQLVRCLIIRHVLLFLNSPIRFLHAFEIRRREAAHNQSSTLNMLIGFNRRTNAIKILFIIFFVDVIQDRRHALEVGYEMEIGDLLLFKSLLSKAIFSR